MNKVGEDKKVVKNRSLGPSTVIGVLFCFDVLIFLIRNQTDRQLIAAPHERSFNVRLTQPARICTESNKATCKHESPLIDSG